MRTKTSLDRRRRVRRALCVSVVCGRASVRTRRKRRTSRLAALGPAADPDKICGRPFRKARTAPSSKLALSCDSSGSEPNKNPSSYWLYGVDMNRKLYNDTICGQIVLIFNASKRTCRRDFFHEMAGSKVAKWSAICERLLLCNSDASHCS